MAKLGEIITYKGMKFKAVEAPAQWSCSGCDLKPFIINSNQLCMHTTDGCGGLIFKRIYGEDTAENNGGSTDYYKLPPNATDIMDLIEHRNMNFSMGNIFKACYRMGECSHSDKVRELNKIIWFAQRELNLAKQNKQEE